MSLEDVKNVVGSVATEEQQAPAAAAENGEAKKERKFEDLSGEPIDESLLTMVSCRI
jgi:hypothetical protein